jgi:hypothetical protein
MSTNETGGAVDVLEALAASWNEKNIGKAEYDRRSVVYAAVAELVATMRQFANCELTEDNCASLDVATRRIRGIARAALAKFGGTP